MSKIFVISDTHFLHDNIALYCGRSENHEELMIQRWNETVSDDDVIFHLGDIAAGINDREGKLIKIFEELKGTKYLVLGNHDKKQPKWYMDKLGFKSVFDYLELEDVFLCHYPLVTKGLKEDERKERLYYKEAFESSEAKYIIHGHVHNNLKKNHPGHFNVSVEAVEYTPQELESIIRRIEW